MFERAFAEAVALLPARDRNLLRFHLIDRLGIDQIAAIYHVHRATAARRLACARGALVASTRARLRCQLAIDTTELASVMRLIESVAQPSWRRVFAEARAAAGTGDCGTT
jgi:RNA polymerase sigma-70 factor (ECF subfamily)